MRPENPAQGTTTGLGLKRQSAWSIAPLLITTLINLVSVRLYIESLGNQLYALLGFVATFTGMFGFADMGLGVAVGRYIGVALGRGDREAVREYWGTGNVIALPVVGAVAVLFAVLGWAFGPHWFNVAPEHVPMLRACFIAGAATLFFNFYGQFWLILSQAHLDFRFLGIVRTAGAIVHILPAVAIAWWTRNPFLVTAWSAVVSAGLLIVYMVHARRRFDMGLELKNARRRRAREMAAYTGKTFSLLVVSNLVASIDRFFLGRLAPQDGAAYVNYTNCAANPGTRLQNIGAGIMMPVFHNTNRELGRGRGTTPGAIFNETFNFVFGWFVLVGVWAAVWHPVVLRAWLGPGRGIEVSPLFTPVIIAFCFTGLSGISIAQLSSLNRVGTVLAFTLTSGLFTAIGVYVGWQTAGVVGVAYGFLFSRVVLIAQDIYTIRLIGADGWLSWRTWQTLLVQAALGAAFSSVYLLVHPQSLWLLIPAAVHGGLVATWLLRQYLRRFLFNAQPQAAGE